MTKTDWQTKYGPLAGYTLLAIAISGWTTFFLIPWLPVPTQHKTLIATGLIIAAEAAFLGAIALLGRDTWQRITSYFRKR